MSKSDLASASASPSTKLVPLDRIQEEFPDFPYGPWATGRLVRLGRLGCVRVGRRIFITRELIDQFIERHTVGAA